MMHHTGKSTAERSSEISDSPGWLASAIETLCFKNGLGAPARGTGHRTGKNPRRKFMCPATMMQKPCAQQPKFITQRDENLVAPSTAASLL
jgi:hypothetical protein